MDTAQSTTPPQERQEPQEHPEPQQPGSMSEDIRRALSDKQFSSPPVLQPATGASPTSSCDSSYSDQRPRCRICFERASADRLLVQPCRCRGSIGFIHEDCLISAIPYLGDQRCELCLTPYRLRWRLQPLGRWHWIPGADEERCFGKCRMVLVGIITLFLFGGMGASVAMITIGMNYWASFLLLTGVFCCMVPWCCIMESYSAWLLRNPYNRRLEVMEYEDLEATVRIPRRQRRRSGLLVRPQRRGGYGTMPFMV